MGKNNKVKVNVQLRRNRRKKPNSPNYVLPNLDDDPDCENDMELKLEDNLNSDGQPNDEECEVPAGIDEENIVFDGEPMSTKNFMSMEEPVIYSGIESNLKEKMKEKKREKANIKRVQKLLVNRTKKYEGCVVKFSCIPVGFTQDAMKNYFEQFGPVTDCVLVKSDKTGRSRQFAFILFENAEVAKIAAETMNNYVAFKRLMKACVVDYAEAAKYWHTERYTPYDCPGEKRRTYNAVQINRKRSFERDRRLRRKHLLKLKSSMRKLQKFGYLYMPPIAEKLEQEKEERERIREEGRRREAIKLEKKGREEIKRKEDIKRQREIGEEIMREKKRKGDARRRERGRWNAIIREREEERKNKGVKQGIKSSEKQLVAEREERYPKKRLLKEKRKMAFKGMEKAKLNVAEQLDGTFNSISSESNKLIMEVDESDTEIQFKTPPNVIKRKLRKRSYTKEI